jgi:hypothetical protein
MLSVALRFTHAHIYAELVSLEVCDFSPYREPGLLARIALTSPGYDGGRALRGFVVDAQGRLVAVHEEMLLPQSLRGRGFATRYNDFLIEWYKAESVHRIELETCFVGGYAWASAGWDFVRDDDRERCASRLRRQVVVTEDAATDSFSTARRLPPGAPRLLMVVRAERLDAQAQEAGHLLGGLNTSAHAISQTSRPFESDQSWVGLRTMFDSAWAGVKILWQSDY